VRHSIHEKVEFLLHTIALEPARWTPQRVSQPLAALIPKIAATPFKRLEVFEPHLALSREESKLAGAFSRHGLDPVILSSYLNISPHATTAQAFTEQADEIKERVDRFGFKKVRLFPGLKMQPGDRTGVTVMVQRLRALHKTLPETEILLETHDGSIADMPQRLVDLVDEVGNPNLGLLYQPTVFQPEPALEQFKVQKRLIRHLHLQNRKPDGRLTKFLEGVIPWPKILCELGFKVDGTLEFLPSGICEVGQFDLDRTLQEAVSEAEAIRNLNPLLGE